MGVLPVVLVVVFGLLAPKWSRPGFWFGVAVPKDFETSSEGRMALRAYRLRLLVPGALAVALGAFARIEGPVWLAGCAPFIAIAGLFWGYLSAHRQVRPQALPVAEGPPTREVAPPPDKSRLLFALKLGPFVILGAAAALLALHWGEIPERFPVHWNARGEVNGWGHKSIAGAFWLPGLGFALCFAFAAMTDLLHKKARAPRSPLSAEIEQAQKQFTSSILLCAGYLVATLLGALTLLPLVRDPGVVAGKILFAPVVFLGVLGLLLVQYGRKVQHLRQLQPEPKGEDLHWKWGLVYVNRDDPAVMIPKRFGVGYTMNFGNKMSWIVMALLLAPGLVAVVAAIVSARR